MNIFHSDSRYNNNLIYESFFYYKRQFIKDRFNINSQNSQSFIDQIAYFLRLIVNWILNIFEIRIQIVMMLS